jgi:hypothetical protein
MVWLSTITLIISRRSLDPFADPEFEAEDVFVNELDCIGRGFVFLSPGFRTAASLMMEV